MQNLITLFMSAPANEHQDTFLEAESEFLTENVSADHYRSRMRAAVIGWINDELGHEIVKCSTHHFTISEDEYNWELADEMLPPLVEGK